MHSLGLDTLFVYSAHHAGYREEFLGDPMREYHIEHGSGMTGWTPEGEADLHARLAAAGIERLTGDQIRQWARQMQRERAPMIFSGENWGLVKEVFPESTICSGSPKTVLA